MCSPYNVQICKVVWAEGGMVKIFQIIICLFYFMKQSLNFIFKKNLKQNNTIECEHSLQNTKSPLFLDCRKIPNSRNLLGFPRGQSYWSISFINFLNFVVLCFYILYIARNCWSHFLTFLLLKTQRCMFWCLQMIKKDKSLQTEHIKTDWTDCKK